MTCGGEACGVQVNDEFHVHEPGVPGLRTESSDLKVESDGPLGAGLVSICQCTVWRVNGNDPRGMLWAKLV